MGGSACVAKNDSTKYMEKIPLASAFAPIGFAPSVPTAITTWERSPDSLLIRESILLISLK